MRNKSTFETNIIYILSGVERNGWDDYQLNLDDFSVLRNRNEYKTQIIASMYEQYFLPERHEWEYLFLKEIIDEITNGDPSQFITVSVISGIVGNAAYDLLIHLCKLIIGKITLSKLNNYSERIKGFEDIITDTEKIKNFFNNKNSARIEEIENSTGVSRERIYPIIKLAGLVHYRRETPCIWSIENRKKN